MAYKTLLFIHLGSVLPCFVIGTIMLFVKKGTTFHIYAGRIYMILMLFTAVVTLFIPAQVGPTLLNHFGLLHSFSLLTLYSVPTAYLAIKAGNVKVHKRKMILLYFGAIVLAGGFTFYPGRYLHHLFFG